MALGTRAAIVDEISGGEVGSITIQSVAVDPGCSNRSALEPYNGHFLIVDLKVVVDDDASDTITLTGAEFLVEGPDGETDHDAGTRLTAMSCDVERVSRVLADVHPGFEYEGSIVLDSAHASGTLVFAPTEPSTEIRWAY